MRVAAARRWLPALVALLIGGLAACEQPAVDSAPALPPATLAPPSERLALPTATATPLALLAEGPRPTGALSDMPTGAPLVVIVPTAMQAVEALHVSPTWSLVRGGIDLSGSAPIGLSYPAAFEGDALVAFDDLQVLAPDTGNTSYTAFINELSGQVYVYSDLLTGAPVLNVHVGTVRPSGRVLEAEPLRQLIEGDLYQPLALEAINANLKRLLGRAVMLRQGERAARFVIVGAVRLSAAEVAAYQTRPGELSSAVGRIAHPEASLLMHICSGQQPGEPETPFPGRYLLVLEH